ncbi:MAG: ribokinase [Chloroflexi bacterium]|nr:ribokinase [Chloroflexota bacterium]
MPAKICVVGSSNMDLISRVPRLPKMGETLTGHSFHLGYGGKGANQAVMAAKLGARVTMVTKLGRDVFGEGTLKNYRDQNIDTTFVLFDESTASGVAPIFVDDQAQNFIVIIPGANNRLSPLDAQSAAPAIRAADVVVCQLEVPPETTLEVFRVARTANVRTILNPAPAAALPDELLRLTDICVPNETEIELLTGESAQTLSHAEIAAKKLLARGVSVVIVTLGERGVLVVEQNAAEHLAPVKVNAVDPTGAGDCFIGSLAVFIGEGLTLREAVRRANAIAAMSVTKIGTQVSFPNRATADEFLRTR